jgi:vacuolar-type H+-ATPase subunit E/Vma4
MALEQLLAVLLREAEAEADAVLAVARTEAERIRERCAADLSECKRRDQATLETERKTAVEFALVTARRNARREELLARERMIERVLEAARARFPDAVASPLLRAAIPAMGREAIGCLAGRAATIHCHPSLMDLMTPLAGSAPGVRVMADPEVGAGFRLSSDDGTLAIDATLEDRMVRLGQRLRQVVVARLERQS